MKNSLPLPYLLLPSNHPPPSSSSGGRAYQRREGINPQSTEEYLPPFPPAPKLVTVDNRIRQDFLHTSLFNFVPLHNFSSPLPPPPPVTVPFLSRRPYNDGPTLPKESIETYTRIALEAGKFARSLLSRRSEITTSATTTINNTVLPSSSSSQLLSESDRQIIMKKRLRRDLHATDNEYSEKDYTVDKHEDSAKKHRVNSDNLFMKDNCSYTYTTIYPVVQPLLRCSTCSMENICLACAEHCHYGHYVSVPIDNPDDTHPNSNLDTRTSLETPIKPRIRNRIGYCMCGSGSNCQLLSPASGETNFSSGIPSDMIISINSSVMEQSKRLVMVLLQLYFIYGSWDNKIQDYLLKSSDEYGFLSISQSLGWIRNRCTLLMNHTSSLDNRTDLSTYHKQLPYLNMILQYRSTDIHLLVRRMFSSSFFRLINVGATKVRYMPRHPYINIVSTLLVPSLQKLSYVHLSFPNSRILSFYKKLTYSYPLGPYSLDQVYDPWLFYMLIHYAPHAPFTRILPTVLSNNTSAHSVPSAALNSFSKLPVISTGKSLDSSPVPELSLLLNVVSDVDIPNTVPTTLPNNPHYNHFSPVSNSSNVTTSLTTTIEIISTRKQLQDWITNIFQILYGLGEEETMILGIKCFTFTDTRKENISKSSEISSSSSSSSSLDDGLRTESQNDESSQFPSVRITHEVPRKTVSLISIGTRNRIVHIDPLALSLETTAAYISSDVSSSSSSFSSSSAKNESNWQHRRDKEPLFLLASILLHPRIVKLFYNGIEDIMWLQSYDGLHIVNAFDAYYALDEILLCFLYTTLNIDINVQSSLKLPVTVTDGSRYLLYTTSLTTSFLPGHAVSIKESLKRMEKLDNFVPCNDIYWVDWAHRPLSIPNLTNINEYMRNLFNFADVILFMGNLVTVDGNGWEKVRICNVSSSTSTGKLYVDMVQWINVFLKTLHPSLPSSLSSSLSSTAPVISVPNIEVMYSRLQYSPVYSTIDRAILRSQLATLYTPPFDAFHSSGPDNPLLYPPWYAQCYRCHQYGHFHTQCTEVTNPSRTPLIVDK